MPDVVGSRERMPRWPLWGGLGLAATAGVSVGLLVFPRLAHEQVQFTQSSALNTSLPWSERIPTPVEWRGLTSETKQKLDLKDLAMHHPDPIVCYLAANECPKELRAEISEYWARERGVMPLPSVPELK